VQRDSLFRISSMTKPFTGAAALVLVQEGLLALDEPVARLLPELAAPRVLRAPDGPVEDTVPAEREITVRHLLTFTAGFGLDGRMFTAPAPWPVMAAEAATGINTLGPPAPATTPPPDEWLAGLATLPLIAQPGERFLYNTAAQILGVLMSRAAGRPYDEVLASRVLEPLGLADTSFSAREPARLVTAYRPTPEGLVAADRPDGAWSRPPAFPDGAAGLVSTADDVAAFVRGLPALLSPEHLAQMTSDQLTPAQRSHGGLGDDFSENSWGFCTGVVTAGPKAGSWGWAGGLGSILHVDPVRDLTCVVLGQRYFTGPDDSSALLAIEDAAYDAMG
jgi:CubicO group peptidase (beta-lactamase class C family)